MLHFKLQGLSQYLALNNQEPSVGGITSLWPLRDSSFLPQNVQGGADSCQEQDIAADRLALSQSGSSADPKM